MLKVPIPYMMNCILERFLEIMFLYRSGLSIRAAGLPEILRIIKLNI
jgi:hypothetical protein